MKKLATVFTMVIAMVWMLTLSSSALAATTTRINIQPSDIPDETQPRVNVGDAPTDFGPDSWQGPATGKTNWHARYDADGSYLNALFPSDAANMTIGDLAEISYFTKRPAATPATRDWWVEIYTRTTGQGDKSGWYHDRFMNNYNDHTNLGVWTKYSTDSGVMTFHSNGLGDIGNSTLDQLITAAGSQKIEMISIQTDSAWNGFDGYIDGLTIKLTNGNVGEVNLVSPVPEPGSLMLLGTGLLGLVGFVRKKKRS